MEFKLHWQPLKSHLTPCYRIAHTPRESVNPMAQDLLLRKQILLFQKPLFRTAQKEVMRGRHEAEVGHSKT